MFIGTGVSGGEEGARHGPSIMPGGNKEAFDACREIFEKAAAKADDGTICVAYIGERGAGHFVKMTHNGIEYAMLQAYAEGLDIIQAKKDWNVNLEKLCKLWNHGSVIRSWLLELAEQVFHDNKTLDGIKGYVEDSGEGRWTVAEAIDESVAAPTITLALLERFHSRRSDSFAAKIIAALRNKFGGHKIKK